MRFRRSHGQQHSPRTIDADAGAGVGSRALVHDGVAGRADAAYRDAEEEKQSFSELHANAVAAAAVRDLAKARAERRRKGGPLKAQAPSVAAITATGDEYRAGPELGHGSSELGRSQHRFAESVTEMPTHRAAGSDAREPGDSGAAQRA